jgi:outer membrane immunogenic protein
MKKLVLGSAGLVVLTVISGSALAADLSRAPPVYTKAPIMAPIYNWNGFYLGINGGGGWGRSRFDFSGVGTTSGDFNTSGGLFGGTAGFNWQSSTFVFGVEGDGDWANIKGSAACPAVGFTCSTSDSWLATARARLGYAANEWLFYVTGGGAFGDVKMATTFFPGQSVTKTGWTAGGGIEYGFAPNWSVKVEYLHVDLGSAGCSIPNCSLLTQANVPFRAEIVRAGLNWRFNWGGPVMARY